MTTVQTRITSKAARRPTCPHCSKRFRTRRVVKKFCTTGCQKEATKLKRRISYEYRVTNSAFFYHLAAEAERAGTLAIFTGHDTDSLVALHDVYKLWLRANKYGDLKLFEISHICAANAPFSVGLYHAHNLVVVPKEMNRAHGTKHYGHGLSIPRASLKHRHGVEKGCNRKALIQRIIQFIGEAVVCEAVKVAKIQPTQRHKLLAWLYDHLDPINPDHSKHLALIEEMSGKALAELKATLEGKEVSSFKVAGSVFTPLHILYMELERHTAIRPDLEEITGYVNQCAPEHLIRFGSRDILTSVELQTVFDTLHGKEVSTVRAVFIEMVSNRKSVMENGQRIPAYTPIVFSRQAAPHLAPTQVVKSSTYFADELDQAMPDVVPVLVLAPEVASVEQFPW